MDLLEEGLKRSMDKLKEKERDKVRKSKQERQTSVVKDTTDLQGEQSTWYETHNLRVSF